MVAVKDIVAVIEGYDIVYMFYIKNRELIVLGIQTHNSFGLPRLSFRFVMVSEPL